MLIAPLIVPSNKKIIQNINGIQYSLLMIVNVLYINKYDHTILKSETTNCTRCIKSTNIVSNLVQEIKSHTMLVAQATNYSDLKILIFLKVSSKHKEQ